MIINVWLALPPSTQGLMRNRVDHDFEQGPYTGPVTERQAKVFGSMADSTVVQPLFRIGDVGRPYVLWSVNFNGLTEVEAKAEIDQLLADFPAPPTQPLVMGGWDFHTGAVLASFPVHASILEMIPDIVTYDNADPPNEISRERPTVPSDVNLLMGQTARQF